ncbi:MAG: hypothetical protein AAGI45_15925, partial [Cyanobacteria bacterium P01_H01_bin.26]
EPPSALEPTATPETAPPRLAKPEADEVAAPTDEISPDSALPDPAPENKAAESEAPTPDSVSPKSDSLENAAILEDEPAQSPIQPDKSNKPDKIDPSEPEVFDSPGDNAEVTLDSPVEVAPEPGDLEPDKPTDELPFLEPAAESSSADREPQSKRRYFQRLYDYRDRSMQTYGRDRN